jgi:pilus assembly protein CpaC
MILSMLRSFIKPADDLRAAVCRGVTIGLLGSLVFVPLTPSWASKENFITHAEDIQRRDPLMVLTVGKAEIVDIDGAVSDIMVADPDIVDVVALQANRMYMVGSKVGNTNIMALDADGNIIKRLNVHVRVDERTLEETIHELFPEENIRARTVNDQVILVGEVSNPTVASQIRDLSARFVGDEKNLVNLVKVSGEMQVMLKVRIMEASRSVLKELGVESSANDRVASGDNLFNNNTVASLGGGATGNIFTNSQTGLTSDPFGVGRLLYDTGINGIGFTELLISALEENNLVNILAEPNLTAVSGEEANFLAGGEFPVPTGRDRDGNIEIEFKPFGVSLNFRPTVMNEDRISLQLKTEVSSLDREQGITIDEIQIPGLDVRRAETIVELNSGGSLMIAGLLKSETVKGMSGIPGIQNTPIIGDLISSDSFNRQETELLIVITPYVVQPIANRNNVAELVSEETVVMPLTDVFLRNVRQVYGDRAPKSPDVSERLGYLID